MLEKFKNRKCCVNQFGVKIPVTIIHTNAKIRDMVWEEKFSGMYTNYDEETLSQKLWERYFELHKKILGEEHEANMCTSDDDVYRLMYKNEYNYAKSRVTNSEFGIELINDEENLIYKGIIIYPNYKGLNKKLSSVTVYDINSNTDTNQFIKFTVNEFEKIQSIIKSIPKRKKKRKYFSFFNFNKR